MISIDEARRIVRTAGPAPTPGTVPLEEASGLVLAEGVAAREPLPHFDNSAMDGFAVVLPDGDEEGSDLRLEVVGEARAGAPYPRSIDPGQAVRISTGAPVPEGTGRVIPVENVEVVGDGILVRDRGRPDHHVRFRGEEVEEGAIVGRPGERVTPPVLARLASFGIGQVSVYLPPTVAVLTTGNELVGLDEEVGSGKIRDTNRYALSALLRELGTEPVLVRSVADTRADTVDAIERAADAADVVLTTGGVSVGPHDHVREAAEAVGFTERFWKVRQKPGKPLFFAVRDRTLLFGLPGNPFSALVNAVVYVAPTVRRWSGRVEGEGRTRAVRLEKPFEGLKPGRARYLLVRVRDELRTAAGSAPTPAGPLPVEVVGRQRSHMLTGVSAADGFVLVGADREHLSAEEDLELYLFPWTDAV